VPYTARVTATRARIRDGEFLAGYAPGNQVDGRRIKTLALMSIPVSPVRREGDDREDNHPLGVK
jgi:hypothetical protein